MYFQIIYKSPGNFIKTVEGFIRKKYTPLLQVIHYTNYKVQQYPKTLILMKIKILTICLFSVLQIKDIRALKRELFGKICMHPQLE